MTHYEKKVGLRTLLAAPLAFALFSLQACVTESPAKRSQARYEELLSAPIRDHYLRLAIEQFELEPIDAMQPGLHETILRVVDASSWGFRVTMVKLYRSNPAGAHGEVSIARSDAGSGRKARSRRELNTFEVRMVSECLTRMRNGNVFVARPRAVTPETVTVDDSFVLIELMDERGYAIGLWPGKSLEEKRVLVECLTNLNKMADIGRAIGVP